MADIDFSKTAWEAAGKPGVSYEDWRWWQGGGDGKTNQKTMDSERAAQLDGAPDPLVDSPWGGMSEEDRIKKDKAFLLSKRRGLAEQQPSDIADIVTRDVASGRVRRARTGSARSALMGPLSSENTSILGSIGSKTAAGPMQIEPKYGAKIIKFPGEW